MKGPWLEAQQTGWIQIGLSFYSRSRKLYTRWRLEWTGKGAQDTRDLPAEQYTAVGTEYLSDRGFEIGQGAEFATDPDGNVWGVYWEEWEDYEGQEYWDGSAWQAVV